MSVIKFRNLRTADYRNPGYPAWLSSTEKNIIDTLIKTALQSGYRISVNDGEEFPVKRSTDYSEITRNVAQTDMTTLVLRRDTPHRVNELVGSILLIHGNEDDVISDCSDNRTTNDLCDFANGERDTFDPNI